MTRDFVHDRLAALSPELAERVTVGERDAMLCVEASEILEAARELFDLGFDRLGMVTAVDYGDSLELVYRLQSRALSAGIFLKARVGKADPCVDSVFSVWPAADWQEREVYDLFGVVFEGHPDLRRILLPDEFVGHPLRKDYDDPRMIRRPDYI